MTHDPLSAIGNTPLVEVPLAGAPEGSHFFAKLEFFNLTGSLKDRMVRYMIEKAEASGRLKPGQILVEATSGNTGIALAAIGRLKGYSVKIAMPENMSIERRRIMAALGAELVLTPAQDGADGAIERAHELARESGHYLLGQFENPDNVLAHYHTTAAEILQQMPDIDTFITGIGTGGTITGVAKRLREQKPQVKVVGIEPYPGSLIQGLRCLDSSVPPILDLSLLDERPRVKDEDAFQTTRRLASDHGLFVGISSGAVMFEAHRQAQKGRRCIVGIFADDGSKYLSTGVFGD